MLRDLADIWSFRELLVTLVYYDIKARYKQAVLGAGWAIIQPVGTMIVFTLIFSRVARVSSQGVPYPVFSYSGLVFWTFFATAITKATLSLTGNQSLIRKIYFPRILFPMVSLATSFVDFVMAFAVLVILMIGYGIPPTLQCLWLPVLLTIQILFMLALSLWTSMLHARFRDIGNAIGLGVQLWMFLTPVAYSSEMVPEKYRTLYMLNPMAPLIEGYRSILVHGAAPDLRWSAIAGAIALVAFALSYSFFRRREATLADFI